MDKAGSVHTGAYCWSARQAVATQTSHQWLLQTWQKRESTKDDENENNEAVCTAQAWEEQCACLKDVSSGRMAGVRSWLGAETATQYQEALGTLFHHHHHSSLTYNLIEMLRCQKSPTNVLTIDITLNKFLLVFINSVGFIISQ